MSVLRIVLVLFWFTTEILTALDNVRELAVSVSFCFDWKYALQIKHLQNVSAVNVRVHCVMNEPQVTLVRIYHGVRYLNVV